MRLSSGHDVAHGRRAYWILSGQGSFFIEPDRMTAPPPLFHGLGPGWSETFWRSPGSRACCFSACAGSLTTQGQRTTPDLSQSVVLLSPSRDRVSTLLNVFSKLYSPAHRYPYLRFGRNLTASPARL